MEVVAPFPCNEAEWPALPCPEGGLALTPGELPSLCREHILIMTPGLSFDLMTSSTWIRVRVDHGGFTVGRIMVGSSWNTFDGCSPEENTFDGCSPEDLQFTAMPSSQGGLDIYIGADIFHVPKHLSVLHPVVQMVLFASSDRSVTVVCEDVCAFRCKKSIVPEGMLDMAKKTLSLPRTKQGPLLCTKAGAPGDGEGTGEYIGVTTDADNQETPHGDRRNVEENKISKQMKTGNGHSGSKPDGDSNMQQQKQQNVARVATGVHLWPPEVARTHSVVNEDGQRACTKYETMTSAMNMLNLPENMNNNSGSKTVSAMAPADCLNQRPFFKDPYQTTPQRANGDPVINFTEQKGDHELHSRICTNITSKKSSSRICSDITSKKSSKNTSSPAATTWIIASAAPNHATGNRTLLSDFTSAQSDIFLFGGDEGAMPMQVIGHGIVVTETIVLPNVWYVPGLAGNLVSVSQLAELDYSVAFSRSKCYVRSNVGGTVVGTAHPGEDGLFALDFLRVPLGR